MTDFPPFFGDPNDTREEILEATYVALCEYGYSDLTIQRIGDEFAKSKSLVYHHYDGKDDLLLDLLEFMLDQAEEMFPLHTGASADEHIELMIEQTFDPGAVANDEDFSRALVELRSQAAHDEQYREYFTRSDRFVRKQIEHIIRSGVEQGVFQEVDPQETAALFQMATVGTTTQRVTSNGETIEDCRAEFERYVRECLLAEA